MKKYYRVLLKNLQNIEFSREKLNIFRKSILI